MNASEYINDYYIILLEPRVSIKLCQKQHKLLTVI